MGGYALVFLSAIMWGTIGIFARYLDGLGVDPFTMVFYRVLFALPFVGLYARFRGVKLSLERSRVPFYVLYGFVCVFLFYTLYFYTVTVSSVSFAVLMLYTAPLHSTVLGYLLFREPVTGVKVVSLAMVLTGVALLTGATGSLEATLLGLASGFTYALYGVLGKVALRQDEPEKVLFFTLLFGLPFLLPFAKAPPSPAIPYLLGLAFFPTFLGYTLYTRALKYVEVSRASIVATVEPVVAIVLAYFLFGETLTPLQLLGGALIIGASVLVHVD